jgi:hypothetical protein
MGSILVSIILRKRTPIFPQTIEIPLKIARGKQENPGNCPTHGYSGDV